MSTFSDIYETINNVTENGIQFFFVSEGKSDIIKAVQYSYVLDFRGKKVYNLGFGDYDPDTDSIVDNLASNNGDPYKVFNTVLNTILQFFSVYENAMMMVWGSDSKQEFQENCHIACKKKCPPTECRNAHRRINIYRNYVNKNYDTLTKEYQFFGGSITVENQIFIEDYVKWKDYTSVLLRKKT